MTYLPSRIDLIRRLPPGASIAEVGVLFGDFSAEILNTPVSRLYLVDPWTRQDSEVYTDTWNEFDMTIPLARVRSRFAEEIVTGRVVVIQDFSAEVATYDQTIPPLDGVFIDGNHLYDYVLQDLILWEKRLKPTGVIMGHDYIRHTDFGVIEAVAEFCRLRPWEIEFLTQEPDWPSYCLKRR